MSRFINPFTDFGFKKIFGEDSHVDLLLDFLNSLKVHNHQITDITFRKSEKISSSSLDRKAFFDLYCQDEKGNRFIIELQKVEQKYFKDRALYYSTFAIQEQAEIGLWDYQLSGVYFIGILDFELTDEKSKTNKYIHNVMLMETSEKEIFYNKLKYVYVEVPKFNKNEDELDTTLDKWLYFLKYLNKLENIPTKLHTDMFIKAFGIAEMVNMNTEKRMEYEESLKAYRDLKVILDESFDKGKIEGEIIGIEKGVLKGKAETLRNKIMKLLTKKLGNIPKALEEKIISCNDIEKLDSLLDNIFDFNSFEEIENIFIK